MAYNTVTVTTSATQIVAGNTKRIGLIVENNSAGTIFLGSDSSVTTSNGIPLLQYATLTEDSGGEKMFQGDVYGIVASGTSDCRYWERVR